VDVVKEVIKCIKGKGKDHKKQWWPHQARWAKWEKEAGSRERFLF
jgi:hypothetical protein